MIYMYLIYAVVKILPTRFKFFPFFLLYYNHSNALTPLTQFSICLANDQLHYLHYLVGITWLIAVGYLYQTSTIGYYLSLISKPRVNCCRPLITHLIYLEEVRERSIITHVDMCIQLI